MSATAPVDAFLTGGSSPPHLVDALADILADAIVADIEAAEVRVLPSPTDGSPAGCASQFATA